MAIALVKSPLNDISPNRGLITFSLTCLHMINIWSLENKIADLCTPPARVSSAKQEKLLQISTFVLLHNKLGLFDGKMPCP